VAINAESLLQAVRGKSIHSMRAICFETSRALVPDQSLELARQLLPNADLHGAMAAALMAGHVSYLRPQALEFLRQDVAKHTDLRVQDCLARGFDHFCLNRGYEQALVTMEEWARDPNDAVRRAVIEAPRVWTRKDYFKAHPKVAIAFVSSMKADSSGTVRF
jgi:DNA alkylation repair enzyme